MSPTSTPARQGSMITTSGSPRSSRGVASSRLVASETSAPFQALSITARTPARTTGWSSTMRHRGASFAPETIEPAYSGCARVHQCGGRRCDQAGSPLLDAQLTRLVQLEAHRVHDGSPEDDQRERVEPDQNDDHEDERRAETRDRGDVVQVGRKGYVDDADGDGGACRAGPDRAPGHEPVRHGPVDDAEDQEEQQ